MSDLSSFATYVRRRLDAWGTEFRLDRDGEFLGYAGKNILQILREHAGEIPERTHGYKPLLIPPLEWKMETIVHDMHTDAPHLAMTLRAYYCGSGRVAVERLETLQGMLGYEISRQRFYGYHDVAFNWIQGSLRALAIGA